jgi:phosphoenolpyruvate carboxylase
MTRPITDQDKLVCLARELQMRRRLYPRQIGSGRMTADEARREIELMEAIVADYRARVRPEFTLDG